MDGPFIDEFPTRRTDTIRGQAPEGGQSGYCRQFGIGKIDKQDLLNYGASIPGTAIGGDLFDPDCLPEEAFDCITLTQVSYPSMISSAPFTRYSGRRLQAALRS